MTCLAAQTDYLLTKPGTAQPLPDHVDVPHRLAWL